MENDEPRGLHSPLSITRETVALVSMGNLYPDCGVDRNYLME